jgi:hypothetical protein
MIVSQGVLIGLPDETGYSSIRSLETHAGLVTTPCETVLTMEPAQKWERKTREGDPTLRVSRGRVLGLEVR